MIRPTPGKVTVIDINMAAKNRVGDDDGLSDGENDGENVLVGPKLGLADVDGTEDGMLEGTVDGTMLGWLEGLELGATVLVGCGDGSSVGEDDGENVMVGRKLGRGDVEGTGEG